jgi:hypothetical protein
MPDKSPDKLRRANYVIEKHIEQMRDGVVQSDMQKGTKVLSLGSFFQRLLKFFYRF